MASHESNVTLPAVFSRRVPEGDNRERQVCDRCGFIHYVNPKIVAGAVIYDHNRVLICRRAIEPARGYWTIPAGYMEEHETVEAAAMREAHEEATARIALEGILAIYSIPRISQVQIIFKAKLLSAIAPGVESLEVKLVPYNEIPWHELAFPSVHWAFRHFLEVWDKSHFTPFSNPEEAKPPSEIKECPQ